MKIERINDPERVAAARERYRKKLSAQPKSLRTQPSSLNSTDTIPATAGDIRSGNSSDEVEIPRDTSGRIRWGLITADSDLTVTVIESLSKQYVASGGELTTRAFGRAAGISQLQKIVPRYYPGGMVALKEKLYSEARVDTIQNFPPKDPSGRVKWQAFKNQDWLMAYIQWESAMFVSEVGNLNDRLMRQKQSGLRQAIDDYYPGGIVQVRQDIGLNVIRRSTGYWTPEKIREEARAFLEEAETRKITQQGLKQTGLNGLSMAIYRKYPGGIRQLRADLNIDSGKRPEFVSTQEANAALESLFEEGL